jgi:hypothetical protein
MLSVAYTVIAVSVASAILVPLSVPWSPKQKSTISLCLLPSYAVLPELYSNAVNQINSFVGTSVHGRRLEIISSLCAPDSSTIIFGPSIAASTNIIGSTKRSIILNSSYCVRVDVVVDVRVLQTAGLFYAVLLHELLHVVGLDHPIVEITQSMSVMALTIPINDGGISQQKDYTAIKRADVSALRRLMARDRPAYKFPKATTSPFIFPTYPASGHVSGDSKYAVPVQIPNWWLTRKEVGANFYYALLSSLYKSADSWDSVSYDSGEYDSVAPTASPTTTTRLFGTRKKLHRNSHVTITSNVAPVIHQGGNIDISTIVSPIIKG